MIFWYNLFLYLNIIYLEEKCKKNRHFQNIYLAAIVAKDIEKSLQNECHIETSTRRIN